nr:hypothetical protein [Tanacetum cinerariifolium]
MRDLWLDTLTNTFSAAGPSNTTVSPTLRKYSYVDPSQYPDDPNMPALEDITYSDDEADVGAEADFTNLETNITVNPDYPDKVYKVVKALYGLHQAPKACQDKYVAEILRKFGLIDGKSASTPIDTKKPLLKDPDGEDADVHTYRSMIGSLMYLTSSRPDIMFAFYACARFHVTPKASHLHAVKRIFRYLKGKLHLGLWYLKDSPFNLVAYSDSDYAGASLDRKSITGGCQFLSCRLISWQCKKQTVVATSSTEAEYVAAASCCAQVLWIQNQKVIITKDTVHQALHLNDAKSIDCFPNEEIFAELARMGYEKPSTKNEFSSSMASTVIYLTTGRKFNFSKYIFDNLVRNVDSSSKFYMVDTPLFEGMLVPQQAQDDDVDDVIAEDATEPNSSSPKPTIKPPPPQELLPSTLQEKDKIAQALEITKLKQRVRRLEKKNKLKVSRLRRLKKGRQEESQAQVYHIDLEHADKVLSMQDDEPKPVKLKEVIEVVTTAKLMTKVVTTAATTITDAPSATRRRKGVVIRDLEETATPSTIVHSEPKSKDKGKGILVEEPKPFKKQAQIEQDEAYAREKPQTEAPARKNMMVYMKNMAGFKMDFFKGMSYDNIRPIFEKHFNSVVGFLEKSEKELKEEASRALKRKIESSEQQAVKKQKLDEEVPVVDNQIHTENNKPYYKVIRADGTHQLFLSFLSLLRNFNKEDLEMLWFTLDQMLNNVRLEVKEESKVSLELLRFVRRQQLQEYTLRDYYCWLKTYCCWYKLKLLDNAADSRLRLLEESAANDKMKK